MTDFCDECSPEIECIRCESAGLVSGIPNVPMVSPMTERQEIMSKLKRVLELNLDKSFGEVIEELAFAHSESRGESLIGGVEDSYILERLDEIIDEHEHGECS